MPSTTHTLRGYADEAGADADASCATWRVMYSRTEVRADFMSGVRSGVNGTPTFFVNGVRYDGDWSNVASFAADLEGAIE